jgi:hypothetical protein
VASRERVREWLGGNVFGEDLLPLTGAARLRLVHLGSTEHVLGDWALRRDLPPEQRHAYVDALAEMVAATAADDASVADRRQTYAVTLLNEEGAAGAWRRFAEGEATSAAASPGTPLPGLALGSSIPTTVPLASVPGALQESMTHVRELVKANLLAMEMVTRTVSEMAQAANQRAATADAAHASMIERERAMARSNGEVQVALAQLQSQHQESEQQMQTLMMLAPLLGDLVGKKKG